SGGLAVDSHSPAYVFGPGRLVGCAGGFDDLRLNAAGRARRAVGGGDAIPARSVEAEKETPQVSLRFTRHAGTDEKSAQRRPRLLEIAEHGVAGDAGTAFEEVPRD